MANGFEWQYGLKLDEQRAQLSQGVAISALFWNTGDAVSDSVSLLELGY